MASWSAIPVIRERNLPAQQVHRQLPATFWMLFMLKVLTAFDHDFDVRKFFLFLRAGSSLCLLSRLYYCLEIGCSW